MYDHSCVSQTISYFMQGRLLSQAAGCQSVGVCSSRNRMDAHRTDRAGCAAATQEGLAGA